MSEYDFDIGILGGGAAGLTVASGAAQLGAKTLLVENYRDLGGDCLHFGCVPSKTLIKTANVYHQMKNADRFGLPPVDSVPVDFREVSARIRAVIAVIQKHDSVERFCSLGARVEFGEPRFTDDHAISLNGKSYSAGTWVIATGSSPAAPPIEGLDRTPYLTNRDIFYLDELPASMIILGGGPIAAEMGQAFSHLGTDVTIVQRSARILGREDGDMADELTRIMTAEGVRFRLGSTIRSVNEAGGMMEVVIATAEGETETLRAEKLLVALGRSPNLSGLGLGAIGVEYDPKGLKVDRRLRTTRKHIYAAGDVTGTFQFTHAAGYEGGVVLANAVFHVPRKTDYTYMPWCTYTSPELASIGMNEKRAREAGINFSVWKEKFADNDRGLAEGEHEGWIKMLLDEKEKPIGVQVLGLHAGEILNEWVAVMNGGVRLSTLAAAIHPYPTLGEINKKVAGDLLAGKIFSEKVKKGLKFFFSLKGRACG